MRRRIRFGWTCFAAIVLLLCTPLLTHAQERPANGPTSPVAAETDSAVTREGVVGRDSAGLDTGTVVFFRGIKMLGAWGGYTIYDGHVELGKLTSGTYFTVQLPAGEHRLVVNSWTQYPQYLSVDPGVTYYVFGTITWSTGNPLLYESPREMFEGMKPILKDVTVKPKE